MKILEKLKAAKDVLDCYKNDSGIKAHSAYYLVDEAIDAFEQEKFCFPNDKYPGISLRDYFAAQALAGWSLCSVDLAREIVSGNMTAADIANACYGLADAMLAKKEKQ